jgi:hypothetical protein
MPGLSTLLTVAILCLGATASAEEPRRTDHGDLILLDVYGSYREMGAQAADLLGDDVRRVLKLNLGFYERAQSDGIGAWLFDRVALPLVARFMSDDTGVSEEAAGYAEALGISRADYLRALIGTDAAGGSTVFVATRSATADQHALVGRNVDWIDFGGLLKPTVVRYHPDNGDFDHISAGWPLLQIPTVGLNEQGLAFSLNYFDTDPQMEPTSMSYPYRRVLQRASTVDEAIALFQADFPITIPCYGALADANGDIALLECTTSECEVFRPEGDWFAHSNHARTETMIPKDQFRGSDSFDRRRLMEAAVKPHLGHLDAARAATVLRNREGHAHPNASVVANLFVLNAAVVEPARRILWHSDRIQPHAPFGSYIPITIGAGVVAGDPIPASGALATDAMEREARAVAQVRAARNARHIAGDLERALRLWHEIFADPPTSLDTAALAIGWADSLLEVGRAEQAAAVLERWVGSDASWDERIHAALLLGVCADALHDRDAARAKYADAIELVDERPEFTAYASIRQLAERGREAPLPATGFELSLWVTNVPP